jgi:hypothetical protein
VNQVAYFLLPTSAADSPRLFPTRLGPIVRTFGLFTISSSPALAQRQHGKGEFYISYLVVTRAGSTLHFTRVTAENDGKSRRFTLTRRIIRATGDPSIDLKRVGVEAADELRKRGSRRS